MARRLVGPAARSHRSRTGPPRSLAVALIALVLAGIAPPSTAIAAPLPPDDQDLSSPTIKRDDSGVIEREPIRLGSSAGGGSGPAGAPVGVSDDASISLRPTDASPETDVKDLWTETSQTERQRDGSFTVTTAAGRMNYQDPAGDWQPIDLTLVAEATDDKTLPKETRKALQVSLAPKKSDAAKQLKLADKISNLRAIADSPPANWNHARRTEYVGWAGRVAAGCKGVNPALDALFDETYRAALARLAEDV